MGTTCIFYTEYNWRENILSVIKFCRFNNNSSKYINISRRFKHNDPNYIDTVNDLHNVFVTFNLLLSGFIQYFIRSQKSV